MASMIIPIVAALAPQYIKKEDARVFVVQQRRIEAFILMGVTLCVGLINFLTAPKLVEVYLNLNITPPILIQYSIIITATLLIFFILISIFLLVAQPNYVHVDAILSKYDNGEMIKTSELVNSRIPWLFISSLLFMGIYIIFSIIIPVYRLTK